MSSRDILLVAIIGVCVLGAVWLMIGKPFTPDFGPAVPKGMHAVCTNLSCGYDNENHTGSRNDFNWPKECPKCGQKTLMPARKCPFCGKNTADAIAGSMQASVKCIHCSRDVPLAPPPMPR